MVRRRIARQMAEADYGRHSADLPGYRPQSRRGAISAQTSGLTHIAGN
jgi:hypothetical protein